MLWNIITAALAQAFKIPSKRFIPTEDDRVGCSFQHIRERWTFNETAAVQIDVLASRGRRSRKGSYWEWDPIYSW